jgi:hypothetical protein
LSFATQWDLRMERRGLASGLVRFLLFRLAGGLVGGLVVADSCSCGGTPAMGSVGASPEAATAPTSATTRVRADERAGGLPRGRARGRARIRSWASVVAGLGTAVAHDPQRNSHPVHATARDRPPRQAVRQAGAMYQFRHAALQDYLTDQASAPTTTAGNDPAWDPPSAEPRRFGHDHMDSLPHRVTKYRGRPGQPGLMGRSDPERTSSSSIGSGFDHRCLGSSDGSQCLRPWDRSPWKARCWGRGPRMRLRRS